jgi:hypothetical protein
MNCLIFCGERARVGFFRDGFSSLTALLRSDSIFARRATARCRSYPFVLGDYDQSNERAGQGPVTI